MSHTITFVTEAHTWGEDSKSSAEILDTNDVSGIAAAEANRVAAETRQGMAQLSARMEESLADVRNALGSANGQICSLNNRLNSLPGDQRLLDAVREAVRAELEPLCGPVAADISAILEDNKKLRGEIDVLRGDNNKLHEEISSLQVAVNELNRKLAAIAAVWKEFSS